MSGRFRRLNAFGVVLLMLVTGGPVWAQESAVSLDIPAGARAGADFDVDRATEAYIAVLSEDVLVYSDSFFVGGFCL